MFCLFFSPHLRHSFIQGAAWSRTSHPLTQPSQCWDYNATFGSQSAFSVYNCTSHTYHSSSSDLCISVPGDSRPPHNHRFHHLALWRPPPPTTLQIGLSLGKCHWCAHSWSTDISLGSLTSLSSCVCCPLPPSQVKFYKTKAWFVYLCPQPLA